MVTVSGPALKRATVVVRDGLIEDVGENVTVPADAWVIEGEGLTVYPGLIDALSDWGIPETPLPPPRPPAAPGAPPPARPRRPRGPRAGGPPVQHQLGARRGPGEPHRPPPGGGAQRRLHDGGDVSRRAASSPAQGAVINLAGEKAGDMVVHPPAGQYMTLATGGGAAASPAR